MSPLFLGPIMNLNHLPWNILYPIRQENHETLAKEDVDFQEMDYSDDGDFENEDEKHLLDLVPSVLETMNNHGKVDIYGYNFTKCWLLPHFRWTI
jgi:hypothetical protein